MLIRFLRKLFPLPQYVSKEDRLRKSMAHMTWLTSLAEPNESYECGATDGTRVRFTREIIESSRRKVDSMKDDPEFQEWVKEWKAGRP